MILFRFTTAGLYCPSLKRSSLRFSSTLESIRKEFLKYEGGNITLTKNEESGIAEICFDNIQKRNAFTGEMMVALSDAVTDLEKWHTGKGLILHSPGNYFCSGAELSMVKKISNSEGGLKVSSLMQDALTRLNDLPLISVALLQGKAIGGGAEIATSCDFRLMNTKAEIQFVQVRMGVVTGWGGGPRLTQIVGPTVALKLLMSGEKVTAEDALKLGLASGVLNLDEDFLTQARNWLLNNMKGSTEVVRCTKSIVVQARSHGLTDSLAKERLLFGSVFGGEAHQKAMNANIKH